MFFGGKLNSTIFYTCLREKVSYGSWYILLFIVRKFLSFRKSGIFFKFPLRKFCYFHFDLLEWKLAFSDSNMLFRCLSEGVWCHKNIINFKNIWIRCLASFIDLHLHYIQMNTFHDENRVPISKSTWHSIKMFWLYFLW